jgi:hypothetical protein
MIQAIVIVGAGNAAAADLALQGKRVRLFQFPEYRGNIDAIIKTRRLMPTGADAGLNTLGLTHK